MSAPLLRRRQEAASQERRAGSRLGAVRLQAEHGAQHGASLRCVLSQCAHEQTSPAQRVQAPRKACSSRPAPRSAKRCASQLLQHTRICRLLLLWW